MKQELVWTIFPAACLLSAAAAALQLPIINITGSVLNNKLSQDNTLELHLGPIPIPGPGGGAPAVQGWDTPLWVRAGRWVSQPGAGWQYAGDTWGQKGSTWPKEADSKPPSWSKDSQPAWASQAGPKSQLSEWIKGQQTSDLTARMMRGGGGEVHQLEGMVKTRGGEEEETGNQRKQYRIDTSLKGWEQKYLDTGISPFQTRSQQPTTSESPPAGTSDAEDDDEEEDDKPEAPATGPSGDKKTNLSSLSHAFEERAYPSMLLLCGESQPVDQDNNPQLLAESEKIEDDLKSYFDGENSLSIPQVPNRPWFVIWQGNQNKFRLCTWLSQGKDYPPKPDPESGLVLVAVPPANYFARVFAGRGGVHQIEDFKREAAALLEDVKRAGLSADQNTIYADSYSPIRDTQNRKDEILVKKI